MANTASKKTINPDKANEFKLNKNDIIKTADFGSFEVIIAKRGAMFKTHTGFHVWTQPYTLNTKGKARQTSLYQWLLNLVEAKQEYTKHDNEPFPGMENTTYNDILDYLKIITEANATFPMAAFVDTETATKLAEQHIKWLGEMQRKLEDAMTTKPKEETQKDIKDNAEHDLQAIEQENNRQLLEEIEKQIQP